MKIQRVIANAVKQSDDKGRLLSRSSSGQAVPRNDGHWGMRTDCRGFVPQPRNDGERSVIANAVKQSDDKCEIAFPIFIGTGSTSQ